MTSDNQSTAKTQVKERPILFSGPMVRAILEGRKTQTRRVFKFQETNKPPCRPDVMRADNITQPCPFGKPGEKLWVRETWCNGNGLAIQLPSETGLCASGGAAPGVIYRADDDYDLPKHVHWRPSIFMPRWACRIVLEITGIRVERLQDISESDATAEGVGPRNGNIMIPNPNSFHFMNLWNSINAKRGFGWEVNPFVWVLTFKRVKQPRTPITTDDVTTSKE